jgi:hypothetical protein
LTEISTIANLQSRRDQLRAKQTELEERQQLIYLQGRHDRFTGAEVDAKTAVIIAERNINDAVLLSTEQILAELIAEQPLQLDAGNMADIIVLFECAFQQKSPPSAAVAALDRLRKLARKETT